MTVGFGDTDDRAVSVEYCGEWFAVRSGDVFSIGREADLSIDENPFLHRRLLEIREFEGIWLLQNVGARLAVTVTDGGGRLQSWLAPGGRLSLVHVAPRFARPVEGWERWDAEYAGTLPALFERLVARLDPPPEILVETVVLRGDPAATLLARVQQERRRWPLLLTLTHHH